MMQERDKQTTKTRRTTIGMVMNARKVILSVLVGGVAVLAIVLLLRQKPGPTGDLQPSHAKEEEPTPEEVAPAEPSRLEETPIDESSMETGFPVDPPEEISAQVERGNPPDQEPVSPPVPEKPGSARPVSGSTVARAIFTTDVSSREPIDTVTTLGASARKVYFFTDIRNCTGDAVIHRWIYRGRTMAEVKLSVGGPRWRTWSSKNLLPEWSGRWSVEVVDTAGTVLLTRSFDYGP